MTTILAGQFLFLVNSDPLVGLLMRDYSNLNGTDARSASVLDPSRADQIVEGFSA